MVSAGSTRALDANGVFWGGTHCAGADLFLVPLGGGDVLDCTATRCGAAVLRDGNVPDCTGLHCDAAVLGDGGERDTPRAIPGGEAEAAFIGLESRLK